MLYLLFPFWVLEFILLFISHLRLVHCIHMFIQSYPFCTFLYFVSYYSISFYCIVFLLFFWSVSLYLSIPICTYLPYIMCSEICMKHYQIWDAVEGVGFNLQTWYLNMNCHFVSFILNTNIWRYIHASLFVSNLLLLST